MSTPPAVTIATRYATFEVWPDTRTVRTTFADGLSCCGAREDTPENRAEAESQGYRGPDAVWRSLVEHELLHSVVAEAVYDRPSTVLRTEAGGERAPLWERYEEEAICLALQAYKNEPRLLPIVTRYRDEWQAILGAWRTYAEALRGLWS